MMKCPKCEETMKVAKQDVSNNCGTEEKYREYDRIQYVCSKDDIWIRVETPKQ